MQYLNLWKQQLGLHATMKLGGGRGGGKEELDHTAENLQCSMLCLNCNNTNIKVKTIPPPPIVSILLDFLYQ